MNFTRYRNHELLHSMTKALPQGDWSWPGADAVCRWLQAAALRMARSRGTYLSDLHFKTMAVLGCGHEETCKAHMWLLRSYGYGQE